MSTLNSSSNRHFAPTLKTLNSFRREPVVDEPIKELQKNCESTEIIIFLHSYLSKTIFFCYLKKISISFQGTLYVRKF